MSHVRKQIRDAVATLLTGLTTTGANVYPSRLYPMTAFPGLCIYTESESIDEDEGKIDQVQHRRVSLVVVGYAQINNTLDDTLDAISAEVETALFNNNSFRALDLISTEIGLSDEAEQDTGTVTMTFTVTALTVEGAPETIL